MIAEQRRSHVLEAFEKRYLKIKGYKVKDDVVEEKFEQLKDYHYNFENSDEQRQKIIRKLGFSWQLPQDLIRRPKVPVIALYFNIGDQAKRFKVDMLLRQIKSANFEMQCFEGLNKNRIYVLLDMNMKDIEEEAEDMMLPVKIIKESAKVPFSSMLKKTDIQPFLIKDRQLIIYSKFDKLFSIEDLTTKGILVKIFPLHNFTELQRMENARKKDIEGIQNEDKWTHLLKFVPHIFRTLEQYMSEHYEVSKFKDLTALKNYFGEKRGMTYAFFDFFATWFLIPTLLCIPLVIYQYQTKNLDSKFSILFALFMSVWSAIFIEMWKRKEVHISLHWGIVQPDAEARIETNPQFRGFNTFSWDTEQESKTDQSKLGKCAQILNLVITSVLLSAAVFFYIFFKRQIKNFIIQGVLLKIAVSVTDFAFKKLTIYFVQQLENRKYKQDYDKSLMTKLACFKFINIHLPIVYALINKKLVPSPLPQNIEAQKMQISDELGFEAAKSYEKQYQSALLASSMYGLILGTVVTEIASAIIMRYGWHAAKYNLYLIRYKYRFGQLASKQAEQHAYAYENLPYEHQERIENLKVTPCYSTIVPDYKELALKQRSKAQTQSCLKSRVQPNTQRKYTSQDEENATHQSIQNIPGGQKPIQSQQQTAWSSPPAQEKKAYGGKPLLWTFVFDPSSPLEEQNAKQNKMQKKDDQKQRFLLDAVERNAIMGYKDELAEVLEMTERMQLVGFSMLYAGLCPIATPIVCIYFILDNYLMRYSESYHLQRPLQTNMISIGQNWINYLEVVTTIVAVTNTFLLFFVSQSFKDFLNFTLHVQEQNRQLWLVLGCEHALLGFLIFLKAAMPDLPRHLLKIKKKTMKRLNAQGIKTFQDIDIQIKREKTPQKRPRVSPQEINNQISQNNQDVQKIRDVQLVDFLKMDAHQSKYDQPQIEINKALNRNFQIKLFRESFLIIERTILQRKMLKLQSAATVIHVYCAECTKQLATLYCLDCLDHLCIECADRIHTARSWCIGHQTQLIDLNPGRDIQENSRRTKSKQLAVADGLNCDWVKSEDFYFPISEDNDFYSDVQLQFEYFKKAYVDFNYIDQVTGAIDFASVFIDQNYDVVLREKGMEMRAQHLKKFKAVPVVLQKENVHGLLAFNDEELFYMNRIAFRLFKLSGASVQFEEFIRDLSDLQSGTFEVSLSLWLKLAIETEEILRPTRSKYDVYDRFDQRHLNLQAEMLSIQKMTHMISAAYPQDLAGRVKFEKIIEKIYDNGQNDIKSIKAIKEFILNDKDANALMRCVLQQDTEI